MEKNMSDTPAVDDTFKLTSPTTDENDAVQGDNDGDQKIAATSTNDSYENNVDAANTTMEEEVSETVHLTSDQQTIYNATHVALNESLSDFIPAPIPKVVSVDLVQELLKTPSNNSDSVTASSSIHQSITGSTAVLPTILASRFTSIPVPNRAGGVGHRNETLLEELEGLEKEEQSLAYKTSLTRYLTELLTGQTYESSTVAIKSLDALEEAVPRRVCQHPFRKNDIVWVCRTCQADETCVLCHTCFSQSNHDGHDVAFYHAQAGGCCDCGDPDGMLCYHCRHALHLVIVFFFFSNILYCAPIIKFHSVESEWILSKAWAKCIRRIGIKLTEFLFTSCSWCRPGMYRLDGPNHCNKCRNGIRTSQSKHYNEANLAHQKSVGTRSWRI
jgi:hypothetical protein